MNEISSHSRHSTVIIRTRTISIVQRATRCYRLSSHFAEVRNLVPRTVSISLSIARIINAKIESKAHHLTGFVSDIL